MNKTTALKVCVAGLGTVGLPTALHVSKFFDVVGYDISPEAVERASSKGILAIGGSSPPRSDIYVLTVNTGNKRGQPDLSAVYNVCNKIAELRLDALVCIESTVPVGTCRNLAEKFGFKNLVCCPHRYWGGDPVKHGVVQTRVLGALNGESQEKGEWFYGWLKIPIHVVSSLEVAEISKIAENAYRFVQIAFAEELKLICDRLGLPFDEVRGACNTKWNIQIPEARNGIGGHCLPKDIKYLKILGENELLTSAIEADKRYKRSLGG